MQIFEGLLREASRGRIGVEVENELRQVPLASSASLWRGGEQPLSALRVGDDVLVKLERGEVQRAWANLRRWRGRVIERTSRGFVGGRDGQPTLDIIATDGTAFENAYTGNAGALSAVVGGAGVDVIGRDLGGAIEASLIRYESGSPPSVSAAPRVAPVRSEAACTLTYNGIASWFNCGTGLGRCGTCSTSRSDQTAWPAFDRCDCCSSTCCDCARDCLEQWYLSCGHAVTVYDVCTGKQKVTFIADCGPCNNTACHPRCDAVTCNHSCARCVTRTTPVVDLTRPTFAFFRDPATNGCFPAKAEVVITCP